MYVFAAVITALDWQGGRPVGEVPGSVDRKGVTGLGWRQCDAPAGWSCSVLLEVAGQIPPVITAANPAEQRGRSCTLITPNPVKVC